MSNIESQIEQKLRGYISRFTRYAGFAHISDERKEILAGTFVYLDDEHDIVPDDVPVIGYLDDLMIFVEAAKHFLSTGVPVSGVCDPEMVKEDDDFVQKHKGMMFGGQHFSMDAIRRIGKKRVNELPQLCEKIKEKYAFLGEFDD